MQFFSSNICTSSQRGTGIVLVKLYCQLFTFHSLKGSAFNDEAVSGVLGQKQRFRVIRNWLLKSGLKNLVGFIVEASESARDCGQFHHFGIFWQYFLESFQRPCRFFFKNWRLYFLTVCSKLKFRFILQVPECLDM